jgi:DNA-binding transcriptional LysR family regulator
MLACMEEHLGVKLFERASCRIALTDDGQIPFGLCDRRAGCAARQGIAGRLRQGRPAGASGGGEDP